MKSMHPGLKRTIDRWLAKVGPVNAFRAMIKVGLSPSIANRISYGTYVSDPSYTNALLILKAIQTKI